LITITLVVLATWRSVRKGEAPIETPSELAEELEAQRGGDRGADDVG
jgi:hypothetical protein